MTPKALLSGLICTITFVACSGCKASLVSLFTPEYKPPKVNKAPAQPRSVIAEQPRLPRIDLDPVMTGFSQPTDLQFEPKSSTRALVLEKEGQLWWLDLAKSQRAKGMKFEVISDSEMGLLGAAFHPRFPMDARLFLNRNIKLDGKSLTRIASFKVRPNSRVLSDEQVLLEVVQPYPNHNAGQLAFGDDGYLYIGLGDGGWRDDPAGHGQNLGTLLGTILRIDVDQVPDSKPYSIPKDNPFVAHPHARPEIFAYGLRNPWRFSFAPDGRLIVADVGQDQWEEVSFAPAGANLGWKVMEGSHCFEPETDCKKEAMQLPFAEYGRTLGKSITGGFVYQGSLIPALKNSYIFADFLSGHIWGLPLPAATKGPQEIHQLGQFPRLISSFGRAANGEVFALDFAKGELLKIVAAPGR